MTLCLVYRSGNTEHRGFFFFFFFEFDRNSKSASCPISFAKRHHHHGKLSATPDTYCELRYTYTWLEKPHAPALSWYSCRLSTQAPAHTKSNSRHACKKMPVLYRAVRIRWNSSPLKASVVVVSGFLTNMLQNSLNSRQLRMQHLAYAM